VRDSSSSAVGTNPLEARPPLWPYVVGLAAIMTGVAGFLYAPISGIVYVALPGVGIATIWAFVCRSPARPVLMAASGAFGLGLVAGAIAITSLASDNFFAQEWGLMAGLYLLPLLGLVLGLAGVLGAMAKPGFRAVRLPAAGELE
jgi:hypothetical protein